MTADERARARAQLDLEEGRGPVPVLGTDAAVALLAGARRIAIVGASPDPFRPSHGVMAALLRAGYDCVPVNPVAETILDRRCHPTLEAAVADGGPFDIVDVFRRPEHVPDVARSAVATGCRALWLQLGVISWDGARIAHEGGLPVVMDRCTAIELRRVPR
jgi:hypothetical protein